MLASYNSDYVPLGPDVPGWISPEVGGGGGGGGYYDPSIYDAELQPINAPGYTNTQALLDAQQQQTPVVQTPVTTNQQTQTSPTVNAATNSSSDVLFEIDEKTLIIAGVAILALIVITR
jgi:hypothetical protein